MAMEQGRRSTNSYCPAPVFKSCARATSFFSLPSIEASPMCSSGKTSSASMVKVGRMPVLRTASRCLRALVAILRPGHFIFLDKIFPFLFIRIHAHAEHNQGLPLTIPGEFLHTRQASRHGAHHVAQKSINTTLPCSSSTEILFPSLVVTANGGGILARANSGSPIKRSARLALRISRRA